MASRPRKLVDRLAAQVALLRAKRFLATAPIGALTERRRAEQAAAALRSSRATVASPATRSGANGATDPATVRARDIADAVRWTATHGLFRPFCLVQSLAIQDLLHAAGIHGSEIRVGVKRDGNTLKAHAWVRWEGEVLGDDPQYVKSFTEVDDIGVLGLR